MAAKEQGQLLSQIINATGIAEVVRVTESKKQIAVLYRVKEKRSWLAVVEYLLRHKTCWEAHICQQYFLRGSSLVYGWNFILEPGDDVAKAVREIGGLVEKGMLEVPKQLARGMLGSFPLVGASPRRTAKIVFDPRAPGPGRGGPSHKGAHNI